MLVRIETLPGPTTARRQAVLQRAPQRDRSVWRSVRGILNSIARDGDKAVRRFTKKFDGVTVGRLRATASGRLSKADRRAIDAMARRVERFHRTGVPKEFRLSSGGVTTGRKVIPYRVAGIYAPGGRAAYPSSVLMGAIPARLAGVERIVLCTPPDLNGDVPPALLYAARRAGVSAVYRVGGAQAIAAMAYGTRTIPKAEIIVGPGNVYVNAAKELLSKQVAIDFVAGPTEILILCDGSADPRFIAYDMAAQAEHDPVARSILVTTDRRQARKVADELAQLVQAEPRREIIRASLRRYGRIFTARSSREAFEFANAYASEHLVLATRNAARDLRKVRSAGSIFVGAGSACAYGDYGAGPNHILPTSGEAARTGALSTLSFLKFVPWQAVGRRGARALNRYALRLAELEGLACHGRSMEVRDGR